MQSNPFPPEDIPLANYTKEQKAFADLLGSECSKRILLFRGQSGCGKTKLLEKCLQHIPTGFASVFHDFKVSKVSAEEFLSLTCEKMGMAPWTRFKKEMARPRGNATAEANKNWLIGFKNQINLTPSVGESLVHEQQYALTNAWFEDFTRLNRALLVVVDTYEDAPAEITSWFQSYFLPRVVQREHLRVVIAGQKVPDHNTIHWGSCCTLHDLYGVPEALDWMPVIEKLGLVVPLDPPLVYLAGLCHGLKGNPAEIMNVIKTFPHRNPEPLQ